MAPIPPNLSATNTAAIELLVAQGISHEHAVEALKTGTIPEAAFEAHRTNTTELLQTLIRAQTGSLTELEKAQLLESVVISSEPKTEIEQLKAEIDQVMAFVKNLPTGGHYLHLVDTAFKAYRREDTDALAAQINKIKGEVRDDIGALSTEEQANHFDAFIFCGKPSGSETFINQRKAFSAKLRDVLYETLDKIERYGSQLSDEGRDAVHKLADTDFNSLSASNINATLRAFFRNEHVQPIENKISDQDWYDIPKEFSYEASYE